MSSLLTKFIATPLRPNLPERPILKLTDNINKKYVIEQCYKNGMG